MHTNLSDCSVSELCEKTYECECGRRHGGIGKLYYGSLPALADRVREILPFGKLLLLSVAPFFLRHGQTVRAALGGYQLVTALDVTDPASLFAFDDGICGVIALGTDVFPLARYFSGVRNLPCIAVPDRIDASRILSDTVCVAQGGRHTVYPAPPPRLIFADPSILCGAAAAYGRLCSFQLSLLDLRFAAIARGKKLCGSLVDLALAATEGPRRSEREKVKSVFEADFRLAYCEREGLDPGAVRALAAATGNDLFALETLVRVYALFFRRGYLRPYACPDYIGRAVRAGVEPTFCELDPKALLRLFELCRLPYLSGLGEILSVLPGQKRMYAMLGGEKAEIKPQTLKQAIYALPERSGFGPLTLMREFGLLEEACNRRKFRRL